MKYSGVPAEIIENRQYLIIPHTRFTRFKYQKRTHYRKVSCLQLNCPFSIMFHYDEGLQNDPFLKGTFKLYGTSSPYLEIKAVQIKDTVVKKHHRDHSKNK